MKEEALKLADDMEGRARIRRQAKDRLSVQEGSNDRLSDQLEQGADMIRKLVKELDEANSKLDKVIPKLFKANGLIENLRAELDKQGEPVAWCMQDKDGNFYDCICPEEHARHEGSYTVPLYTAPQTKPLSDEEIEQIAVKWYIGTRILPIGFARAIEERHGIK